ncbi:hypothetical protein DP42_5172 [Burkholderia pseudomallei]|nr:hypothetical protein DP42_5172 [Burkholderia pseudomallei]
MTERPARAKPKPKAAAKANAEAARREPGARASASRSRIERRVGQRARQRIAADVAQPVVERIVQRVRARVAPEAVERERRGRRACAARIEQRLAHVERGALRDDLRLGDRERDFRARIRRQRLVLRPRALQRPRRAIRERLGAHRLHAHVAEALQRVRIVRRALDARMQPRPPRALHVVARLGERALRDADEQIRQHELRHERAQRRARRRRRLRPMQDLVGRHAHAVERHAAAVGLALADRVPVVAHRDPFALRRHDREHRLARDRIVRGHRHPLRAARARAETLDAVEPVAAVARRARDEPRVERIHRVAPPPVVLDRAAQIALALRGAAPHVDTDDLQALKAEQMRERAVHARERADRVVDHGPARFLAAEFARHREREQACVGDPALLARRVAARAIALRRARAQHRDQLGERARRPAGLLRHFNQDSWIVHADASQMAGLPVDAAAARDITRAHALRRLVWSIARLAVWCASNTSAGHL